MTEGMICREFGGREHNHTKNLIASNQSAGDRLLAVVKMSTAADKLEIINELDASGDSSGNNSKPQSVETMVW
jgi:hypothetical protein